MIEGDFVSVIGGRGYRPGIVEDVGKRTTMILWADDTSERINNKRIVKPKGLKEVAFIERMFKLEKSIQRTFDSKL